MKERVNANLCEFESRLDTRGLAALLKLSGSALKKKIKKNAKKKWDYSAPISGKEFTIHVIEQY